MDGTISVTYRTPKGPVTVSYEYSEDMRCAGASISRITKYALTEEEDYDPLIHLFEHIEVEPYYDGLARMTGEAGEDAIVPHGLS